MAEKGDGKGKKGDQGVTRADREKGGHWEPLEGFKPEHDYLG